MTDIARPSGRSLLRQARTRPFDATLRDGRGVRIRPVGPEDRRPLLAGLRGIGPRSRYLQYHRLFTGMTERAPARAPAADRRAGIAWAAFALDGRDEPGVAAAQYVRDRVDRSRAELTIAVIDDYRRVGLGTLLLETLMADALQHGIEVLTASLFPAHLDALALFERVGGQLQRAADGGLTVEIAVTRARRSWKVSQPILSALPPELQVRHSA